jgi:hypothetical protein
VNLEDFVKEVRKEDPELAFEYACLPDVDEFVICSVNHNTGTCSISRLAGGTVWGFVPLSRLRFKAWRHAEREPGYPGDIVELLE